MHDKRDAHGSSAVADTLHIEVRHLDVGAVRVANGDGKRTAARALHELLGKVGVSVVVRLHEVVRVRTIADVTELGLDVHTEHLGNLYHIMRKLEVLLVGKRRAVDHDGRKTSLDALHRNLVTGGVVLVDGNRHARALGIVAGCEGDDVESAVVVEAGPVLDDDGHVLVLSRLNGVTNRLRIDDVDRGYTIVMLGGVLEKLVDFDECHVSTFLP